MATFSYGWQQNRALRKGIWLRVATMPDYLRKMIRKELPFPWWLNSVHLVKVEELRPDGHCILQVWATRVLHGIFRRRRPTRYTVFHLYVKEDPDWSCEVDHGRGMAVSKKKKT